MHRTERTWIWYMESIYLYLSWMYLRRFVWGIGNCALRCCLFVSVCMGLLLGENQLCVYSVHSSCDYKCQPLLYQLGFNNVFIPHHVRAHSYMCVFAHFFWYSMWKCIIECRFIFLISWNYINIQFNIFSTPTQFCVCVCVLTFIGGFQNSMVKFLINLYLFSLVNHA